MYEPRHPGDAEDLPAFISRAPTDRPVLAIRDVLVVPTTIVEGDYPSLEEQPAGDPAVEIADGILQRALLLISVALEGLIQSDRQKVSRQFRERLPKLAAEVGVEGIDEQFAVELYEARSEAAHGAQVSMFQPKPQPERPGEGEQPEQPHGEPEPPEAGEDRAARVALAQDLLRAATRRAIQDPDFRQIFASEETVAAKWPVQH